MKKTIGYLFACGASVALILGGCSKSETLPAIDGYNNSNEVAKTNLVAHWNFDGTNNERLSSTAPTKTYGTVGFATGQIGQALKLTQGAMVYPAITAINGANALNNFTVSLWINVNGSKGTTNAFTSFFGLIPTGVTDIWPDVCANAETSHHKPGSDTLELKNLLNTHPAAGGNSLQDNLANGANNAPWFMGGNKWAHYVMRWDGTTHQFHIFGNGVSVGSFTDRGTTGVEIMSVPVQAVFGSLASKDIGFTGAPAQQTWNPWATAMIDDVRVFNTALADKDITALYDLGLAGR
ncbi:hypothetical protein WSM22_42270 [Cytophagales bacterium WSM2-2]|nr:hypothetical protein WSM22_42270 [Cytophagales bacterium WSM2-2]